MPDFASIPTLYNSRLTPIIVQGKSFSVRNDETMSTTTQQQNTTTNKKIELLEGATVRLAGDSGDGMQLLGTQLTNTSALLGNDVATFPDFPAEIRAPRGTRAGVSGFQVQFSSQDIFTPGDRLDALVCMNPAALITNVQDLRPGGLLVVNEDGFTAKDLKLANLDTNPLEDGSLDSYQLIKVPMTALTRTSVEELGLGTKMADRCKNFFAMGVVYWLFGRDLDPTLRFIEAKFGNKPDIAQANEKALASGLVLRRNHRGLHQQLPRRTRSISRRETIRT